MTVKRYPQVTSCIFKKFITKKDKQQKFRMQSPRKGAQKLYLDLSFIQNN